MKLLHSLLYIVIGGASLYAEPFAEMYALREMRTEQMDLEAGAKKKPNASRKKKKASSARSKKRSTSSLRNQRSARRSVATRVAEVQEELQQMDKIDPLPLAGRSVTVLVDREPVLIRFRRGDTSLDMRSIESLYFGHESKADEYAFLTQIESEADALIRQAKYQDALKVTQRGLWRNPMHLGLLKRACDLTHHEQLKEVDKYVWQLAELMHLISKTGDGKTHATAYRVMSRTDAILYETEWLSTPLSDILERRELIFEDKPLMAFEIKGAKGQPNMIRYYSIRQ